MRNALLLSFFLLLSSGLAAQITLSAAYFPSAGDTLILSNPDSQSLATIDIGATGGPQTWDFSNLEPFATFRRPVLATEAGTADDAFPTANLKILVTDLTTNYYLKTATEFSLVGTIGASDLAADFDLALPFANAYTERRAPLSFIDQNSDVALIAGTISTDSLPDVFSGIPDIGQLLLGADSIRFGTTVTTTDLVDAYGTLLVDEAEYEVIREKRNETRMVTLEVRTVFGWVDVTGQVSGLFPDLINQLGQDTIVQYTYWADGVKEPVMQITTSPDGETVERASFKSGPQTVSVRNPYAGIANGIRLFPNPAATWFRLESDALPTGTYRVEVYNTLGRLVRTQPVGFSAGLTDRVELNRLPNGVYLASLYDTANRLVVTKRVLVGR